MKKTFLVCLFLFFVFTGVAQKYIEGRVVRVADGDTFTIVDKYKKKIRVRFFGIDCPEIGQDYAHAAKSFTSSRTLDKTVKVEVKSKDRYGRIVGVVWLDRNTDLNLLLLQAGLAWDYPSYSKSREYHKAEAEARARKVNIWSQKSPIAPWDYRKAKNKKKKNK
ncbi:MAG: thermonuclease family protein [Sphingobacterium sp.]|jgi:endonuclease YncB( thermonuclease family)|nr:thermonuclease family protein [Sphingobacterium sp.]